MLKPLRDPNFKKGRPGNADSGGFLIDFLKQVFRNIHVDPLDRVVGFHRLEIDVFRHVFALVEILVEFFRAKLLLRFLHDKRSPEKSHAFPSSAWILGDCTQI